MLKEKVGIAYKNVAVFDKLFYNNVASFKHKCEIFYLVDNKKIITQIYSLR